MKLRIQQNFIRIRLSKGDIRKLGENTEITESLHLPESKIYHYRLRHGEENNVATDHKSIIISVSKAQFQKQDQDAITWITKEGLKVLIERDLHG
ncbi:MAG: hypothetical protein R8G66_30650 [Cytophagales bacterium]|nr:hypothetical protein [Cytophagales bacterium]